MRMHLDLGSFNGMEVLSAGSVIEMQKDQTFGVRIAYTPHPDARRYGLGIWRDIVDGPTAVQLSSQGLFGFSPWVDNERGYFGVFLVEDYFLNVYSLVAQIQATVRGIIDDYDTDGDGQSDGVDADDDADGYGDALERSMPLCANGVNDDQADDAVADDGCPSGASQAGVHAEGEFRIGTWSGVSCEMNGWPSDFVSGGTPDSTNRVTITDLTSFLAPYRHLDTSPGSGSFNARWDLEPGRGLFLDWINISDLTALIAGDTGYPPMLGGSRAFDGPPCA
jgi:hypothetical protein